MSLDNRSWCGYWDRRWLASRAVKEGCNLAKILPVPLCDGSGSVNTDGVTVIWSYLNDNPSLGPLARIVACLVLYCHTITWLQWWKVASSSRELLCLLDVSLGIGSFPVLGCLSPLCSGLEFSRLEGQEVSQYSAKDNLGWGET